jgi:xylose isomerase
VLEKNGYGKNGEAVGLDVKAMRTTRAEDCTKHLANSRTIFLALLDIVRGIDEAKVKELRDARQYEELDLMIIKALMGR